ncbi:MBL fold metallo-hydrolase [Lancefieldella parvula]|uniref:MBL fold metallo-hydrolase n=1 Tax=Lancefieldella parvula TaxID=1382 RepID=UPI00288B7847|nr:MBL fold metallo-hydrolase [Lancefieldella parvula]
MPNPTQFDSKTESPNTASGEQSNYFFALILSLIFGIFGIPQLYLKGWKSGLTRLVVNVMLIVGAIILAQILALPALLSYLLPAILSYPVIESALNLIYEDANASKKLIKGKLKLHKRYAGKQKAGIALASLSVALYFSAALTQPLPTTVSTADISGQQVTVQATNAPSQIDSGTSSTTSLANTNVTIKFIDVGQGEAILIALPEKTMLIDAGPTGSAPKISQVLHELGREKIDYLIATHPDEDHIGGMADIISSTQIGTIYAPNKTNNTATYRKFLTAIQSNNLQITLAEAGTIIDQTNDYKIEILWPTKDADFPDTNDYSIIIKLTVGNKTFLFTGDAPTSAILQSNPGHIDVLKLSHHGSRTGTNEQLVRKLSPTYAVISYALDNSYGHPMQSVLNALHKHSVEIWGTGANGTITITCDGTTIDISGEKNGTVVAPTSQEKSGTSSKSRTK